ncbi:MAG: glycosyltransferase [Ruminococcus sp.]|uniref:glycosyltransferase n=1 Tax=Ruminococcus sp. TaxID=41978 RepID=UPI003999FD77
MDLHWILSKRYLTFLSHDPQKVKNNIIAYKQLKKIIDEGHYDVVHCNTPMGGIVTRLAARNARKHGTKVYYTAHGFHFYKGAPKKNWIVFYPIEKFFCRSFYR